MQTDIYYGDITKTDNLESYLMEKVEGAVTNFFKYDDSAHLTVRVTTTRHRTSSRKPAYICEVILKPTHTKATMKVCKTDESFKACVAKTVAALKHVLSKRSDIKATHHRHDPFLTAESEAEPESESAEYALM